MIGPAQPWRRATEHTSAKEVGAASDGLRRALSADNQDKAGPSVQTERKRKMKIVYMHILGNKIKFSFKYSVNASIAGRFEKREFDGQVNWHYVPSPGMSHQPDQAWLYRNQPN